MWLSVRTSRVRAASALAVLLAQWLPAGCGAERQRQDYSELEAASSAPPTPPQPSTARAPDVAPLVIVPLRHFGTHGRMIELRADGSLVAVDTSRWMERPLGRIEGTRVLTPDGEVLLDLSSDGRISWRGGPPGPSLTDDGRLMNAPIGHDLVTVTVHADGRIEIRGPDGHTELAPMRFESVPVEARRTAAYMMAWMLLAWNARPDPSSSP